MDSLETRRLEQATQDVEAAHVACEASPREMLRWCDRNNVETVLWGLTYDLRGCCGKKTENGDCGGAPGWGRIRCGDVLAAFRMMREVRRG